MKFLLAGLLLVLASHAGAQDYHSAGLCPGFRLEVQPATGTADFLLINGPRNKKCRCAATPETPCVDWQTLRLRNFCKGQTLVWQQATKADGSKGTVYFGCGAK